MYCKHLLTITAAFALVSTAAFADSLEQQYWNTLDKYAASTQLAQEDGQIIFDTCSKLVMLTATYVEKAAFSAGFKQEEYDFRVNVCGKATVNMVHPQPEFSIQNKDITDQICINDGSFIYKVCKKYLGY
jgi:hypothetical protein